MARRPLNARPVRPAPVCEDCGADVWWAWGIHGKKWTPLVPERFALESGPGRFEVWRDAHGGLLCKHRPEGERGDMDQSWRGNHHNAVCARYRDEATGALLREVKDAVPLMEDRDLLVLGHRLRELGDEISGQIRRRAMQADADDKRE